MDNDSGEGHAGHREIQEYLNFPERPVYLQASHPQPINFGQCDIRCTKPVVHSLEARDVLSSEING